MAATADEIAAFNALTEREKMIKGLAYMAMDDRDLAKGRLQARALCKAYNDHPPQVYTEELAMDDQFGPESRQAILAELFGIPLERAKKIAIEPPLNVDYGTNIVFKGDFYANFGLIALDCAPITFGDKVIMAPGVQIYSATHSVELDERRPGYERAYPVTIGDETWVGGGAIIIGPTTIGKGCTVAAGAVVRGDFPDNVVIAGNPARVVKVLEEPKGFIDPNDKRLMVPLPVSQKGKVKAEGAAVAKAGQ